MDNSKTDIFLDRWTLSQSGIILFCLFLVLQLLICSIILYETSLSQTRDYLKRTTLRAEEDVKYKHGRWDTSLYNADGVIPDINPLYIITSDGFVIERWKPIHGFLDEAEYNRLLAYTQPKTINTITNEDWRVLSKPIIDDEGIVGVITVAAYKPEQSDLTTIDNQLRTALNGINSDLILNGNTIDVNKIDARKLPYTITFQVVNKFNKLLIQNDNTTSITRSPSFIDSSYVADQLGAGEEQVEDAVTKQIYLTLTTPIYGNKHSIIGIVVVGSPIDSFFVFVEKYTLLPTVVTCILLLIFLPFLIKQNRKQVLLLASKFNGKKEPKTIAFSKKDSKLMIDQDVIKIPYASYQYYFCEALFSKPTKRWEIDELLEKFGEDIGSNKWHKIYDTMVVLNKKTNNTLEEKLFITNNKTYSINPLYSKKILPVKN